MKENYGFRMLRYFKSSRKDIVLFGIFMFLYSMVDIIIPVVEANLVTGITKLNVNSMIYLSLLLVAVFLFSSLMSRITDLVFYNRIKKNVFLNIRKDMIKNIFNMKLKNFDKHSSGEFSERLRNDPESISFVFTTIEYNLFLLITDIFILVYVFFINYLIGIVYLIGCIIIYLYQSYVFKQSGKLFGQNKDLDDKNAGLLNETMRGIKDIKYLNIRRPVYNLISDSLRESTDKKNKKDLNNQLVFDVIRVINAIVVFIVLFVGIVLIKNGKLSGTNLIIVFMYRTNIADLTFCIAAIKQYLEEYKVASKRIFELMNEKKFPKEKYGTVKLDDIGGKVEVKNLSFSYGKKQVLNCVNILVNAGESIGIVGSSGSGKSTLLSLIAKGYEVDDGHIFIDDIDINNLSEKSIRDNISFITQSPYLFNVSICKNLEFTGASKKEIKEACKISQIDEFIESLPDKYDTLIGEGGVSLSGGQKQRLAVARALLKKSKIILFDEATSALDNITQMELQKAISKLSYYTMIIVAHRLSTIKDCDKIYVLDDGKIVGCGTHEDLLSNKYYKRLYRKENS